MLKVHDVAHQSENGTIWWMSDRYATGNRLEGVCVLAPDTSSWTVGDTSSFHEPEDGDGVTIIGHCECFDQAVVIAELAGMAGFVKVD